VVVEAIGFAPQLQLEFPVGGQEGGLAFAVAQAGGDGPQVGGVGFAPAALGLGLPFALAEQGVDEAVVHCRGALPLQVGGVAVHQSPRPVFVVEADGLVAQDHPVVAAAGQQPVNEGGHLLEAGAVAADFQGLDDRLEVEAGVGSQPVDILADVQDQIKCGIMGMHEWFSFLEEVCLGWGNFASAVVGHPG